MTETPVVTVKQGRLQGRVVTSPNGNTIFSFQGIPYAKPPLGSLRFKAPQQPDPWEGVRKATAEGNVSPQIYPFVGSYLGDEDCLFLNVYTPSLKGKLLPVMIWIHGGGFHWGSGNTDLYGGDYLVEKDVVVVTINYRCDYLGFLCLNTPEVPGNAGVKDMVQAIKWVKDNIHNFGGDQSNITIFGESAGGIAVSLLCASPLSKDLINRAIIQSNTALAKRAFQGDPVKNARDLAKHLGCDAEDVDAIHEFLTAIPAKEIIEAHASLKPFEKYKEGINICGLVVEKEFPGVEAVITEDYIDILTSGRMADIPIMIGRTSVEMAEIPQTDDLQAFIPIEFKIEKGSPEALAIADKLKSLYFKGNPTDAENWPDYFRLISDKYVNIDARRFVQYLVQSTNSRIYFYIFDYIGTLNISNYFNMFSLGYKIAAHMDELGYLFKNNYQNDIVPTPLDIKMRERMVRLWTNFAKFGNPTPEESHYLPITWLPVTKDEFYYLNLGSELTLLSNPDKDTIDFWEEMYTKHFRIWDHPRTNTTDPPRKIKPMATTTQDEESKTPSALLEEKAIVINEVLGNGIGEKLKTVDDKIIESNKHVIRANDPPEDDLPKDTGVNKFVSFYESLGGKK